MKKLVILYGEQNAGKTSTLRLVFELLTGTSANLLPPTDLRVVIHVGRKTVYLASHGDAPGYMKTNFNFFTNKMYGNLVVYEFLNGQLVKINKTRFAQLKPNVCVTACRVYYNDKANDTYNALNKLIMKKMPVTEGIIWIPKQKADEPKKLRRSINDDMNVAKSIISVIRRRFV